METGHSNGSFYPSNWSTIKQILACFTEFNGRGEITRSSNVLTVPIAGCMHCIFHPLLLGGAIIDAPWGDLADACDRAAEVKHVPP